MKNNGPFQIKWTFSFNIFASEITFKTILKAWRKTCFQILFKYQTKISRFILVSQMHELSLLQLKSKDWGLVPSTYQALAHYKRHSFATGNLFFYLMEWLIISTSLHPIRNLSFPFPTPIQKRSIWHVTLNCFKARSLQESGLCERSHTLPNGSLYTALSSKPILNVAAISPMVYSG